MEDILGAIRLWTVSAIPKGWAACDGSLLKVAEHKALYSLLGTRYGGDGQIQFGLPDLRGRAVIGSDELSSQGPPELPLGTTLGEGDVTLQTSQIPTHTHYGINISNQPANLYMLCDTSGTSGSSIPENGCPSVANTDIYSSVISNPPINMMNIVSTSSQATATVTGSQYNSSHTNVMPSLGLYYIICINGIYPSKP